MYSKWFCDGDIRGEWLRLLISHNFFRISVLNQFVFRGPGSNAHKKRRWTDDGLDSTTTRLSSRDVRYFSIMGSMGLCMGSICARKDINWRAFCISRLQGMFWFDSFSLVLGIIGIHVDKIQDQVSASVLLCTLFSRNVSNRISAAISIYLTLTLATLTHRLIYSMMRWTRRSFFLYAC